MPKYPFEVSLDEILQDPEQYVDAVFSCLESEFLVMPKGVGFVEYPVFERGYEALKSATSGFARLAPENVYPITISEPIAIVVLRTMLGFTPPEWGYVTTQRTGITVLQGFVRSLDRKVRMAPETPLNAKGVTEKFNPQIIIEAKITEDDGTARDKVTRIQHLGELSLVGQPKDKPKYEVVACIGGRGFGVRREDMKKMILATKGKVFTAKTLNKMIDYTRLKEFRTK